MPKTARPVRVYDFTAASMRAPTTPPPGDRLDAQFAEHASRIVELQLQLETIDASLNLAAVDASERPQFLAEIRAAAEEARQAAAQSLQAVADAELKLRAISAAAARVEMRAKEAASFLVEVDHKVDEALGAAEALKELTQAPTPPNQPLEGPKALGYNAGGPYATDVMGATATSADYAEVSINWAEYMPWTIPPNILAINAITGEHWSSRWWAHRAGEFVGGFLNGYYMGPFPTPPVMGLTGGPILLGALYFNTADNVMYVWNGTAWIPFHTPQAAATGSFFFIANPGDTNFDLTAGDIYGNLLPAALTPEEGIEVHLNGVRLAPWTATVDGDYTVDVPSSSVVLQEPAQDQALLIVDVLMDKAKLAPAFVAIEKLRPFPVDGVETTFPLLDSLGTQLTLLDASQIKITLDGVDQEPGRDFTLDVAGQNVVFLTPPDANSNVFTIWFSNSLIGAGGSIVVVHDATLRGQGTVAQPLGVVEATQAQQGAVHIPAGSALTIAPDGALGMLVANAGQVATGTNNTFPITPQRLRGVMGDDVANLNTAAKTAVPAINELLGLISGAQQLIGNMNAATSQCVFDPRWGIPNGVLPAAAAGNSGKYVIVTVAGTPALGPPETHVPTVIGDWFISTGAVWLHLAVGNATATAANVSLNPFVFGVDNVQDALEEVERIAADEPFLPLSAGAAFPLTDTLFGTNAQFINGLFTNLGVTGVMTVTGPNSFLLSANVGLQRSIIGATLNTVRWQMSLGDATPEAGANAGSNFELNACSDAGGVIVRALFVERATGFVSVAVDPVQPLQVATKRYVDSLRGLVPAGPTPPANPEAGQLWWRSDPDGELYIFYDDGDSLQWVPASPTNVGGGGGGGAVETDPLSLHLTGGQMTGALLLAADPVNPAEAATKAYVDTTLTSDGNVPTGGTAGQVLAKRTATDFDTNWVDPGGPGGGGPFLPLAGGTMSGAIQSTFQGGGGSAALQHINGNGALSVGLMLMSVAAPGGAFSFSYQANDNQKFRLSHTTSGVPTTTHRIEIEGAAGPINLNGVAQVARAPTAANDIANKAYVDAQASVAGDWGFRGNYNTGSVNDLTLAGYYSVHNSVANLPNTNGIRWLVKHFPSGAGFPTMQEAYGYDSGGIAGGVWRRFSSFDGSAWGAWAVT